MVNGHRKSRKTKFEIAQTMVEFALVFPIVLLITYGIIEVGRAVFIYTAVTSAAREGARYGAATGDPDTNPKTYMDCVGIGKAIRKTAILTPITDAEISVWYDHGPGTTKFPNSNICPTTATPYTSDLPKLGDRIVVHLAVPFAPIIKFVNFGAFTIVAENGRTILARVPLPYP
jgi:hypothetical protein